MAWQGDIPDVKQGGARRIFILKDNADGKHIGIGERHALTDLRRVPAGARVWFRVLKQRATGKTINGRPQMIWEFDGPIVDRILDHPVPVTTIPSTLAASDAPPPPLGDDDIPF